jgi:hypothetical protein
MPILPNGAFSAPPQESSGGSPRGWSFISTALACWRRWYFKYVIGLYPAKPEEALRLGAAFHVFMEGKSPAEAARDYPDQFDQAKALAERRMAGPPLPPATHVEQEFVIFGGAMTSKPDRIELHGNKPVVRDFKTASFFSEHDEVAWNADGGILGECIAAQTDTALVDITSKNATRPPFVKIVTVKLTDAKRAALERTVEDFWEQAEARVKALAAKKDFEAGVDEAFPRQLSSCVGKYGPCPYYARCWGSFPEFAMYRLTQEAPRRWVDFEAGPQPREWKAGKVKALEAVQELGRELSRKK